MIRLLLFLVMLIGLLLAACAAPVDPNAPPEIVYGEDVCDRCGMIISDARFAASVVVEHAPRQYDYLLFDDIGGMIAYIEERETTIVSYFVHDYNSKEWLDAGDAVYVLAPDLPTPMGFGIAAFGTHTEAEAEAAAWGGEVLDFQSLRQQSMQPMHMGHVHDSH